MFSSYLKKTESHREHERGTSNNMQVHYSRSALNNTAAWRVTQNFRNNSSEKFATYLTCFRPWASTCWAANISSHPVTCAWWDTHHLCGKIYQIYRNLHAVSVPECTTMYSPCKRKYSIFTSTKVYTFSQGEKLSSNNQKHLGNENL